MRQTPRPDLSRINNHDNYDITVIENLNFAFTFYNFLVIVLQNSGELTRLISNSYASSCGCDTCTCFRIQRLTMTDTINYSIYHLYL